MIKKKDKKLKKRMPAVCRALQVFSIILFIFVLFFSLLSYATTEKNLSKMTRVYVDDVEIDKQYFDGYYLYDFTEDMCRELLEGEKMKALTSDIMKERLMAIFHNTSKFDYTEEEIKSTIHDEVVRVAKEGGVELKSEGLEAVVDYTCDISGISTMLKFKTPAQYRTAIYDADRESIDYINSFLVTLSKISSPLYAVFMLVLYLGSLVILVFLSNRFDVSFSIANTAIYPSLAIFAFSIGEIFMPDASVVTDYIFRKVLVVSGAGVILGILLLVIYNHFFNKKFGKDSLE